MLKSLVLCASAVILASVAEASVQEVFCDTDGILFNQTGPFETRVALGDDGLVSALHVFEGDVEIIRDSRVSRL